MKRRLSISTAVLAARVLEGFRERSAVLADFVAPEPSLRPIHVRDPRADRRGAPPR